MKYYLKPEIKIEKFEIDVLTNSAMDEVKEWNWNLSNEDGTL